MGRPTRAAAPRDSGAPASVVRREQWNEHWARRRRRDPHQKLGSFRYASSLDLWPRGARAVLDVAGGDGTFAFLARERFPASRITVVDSAPAGCASALERGFAALVVSVDGARLPFADASFDLVTSLSVLQDVLQPWRLLDEMVRVSRRWLLISCPNFASLGNRADLLRGGVPRQMRHDSHVRFITYADVHRQLERRGVRTAGLRTRHKLPILRSLPVLWASKPALAHRLVPNLAAKFTILGEKISSP